MKKRIESLVALGLVVALATGCGSTQQQESSKTSSAAESDVVAESTQDSEAEEESAYPEYLNLDGHRPIVNEGEEITLKVGILRSPVAEADIDEVWFANFIEQELNINLEFEEYTNDNLDERKNLMMVSGDMPDLLINMEFSNAQIVEYGVGEGMLLPLSDYMNEELTPNILAALEGRESAIVGNTAPDGKMYTLPSLSANTMGYGSTIPRTRVFVNKDYLDAAGITELPTNLDGFADMLRAFKALDPAEMGVEEIYPMMSTSKRDREYILNAFGFVTDWGSNPTYAVWDTVKDQMTVPSLDEKYEDYVTYMHMLYEEGLIHPDYFTIDDTAAEAIMAEGAAGVIGISAPYLIAPETYENYVSMGIMTSDVEPDPYIVANAAYGIGRILVSAKTEYPEVCMRFLDYLYTDEGVLYSSYGPVSSSEDTLGLIEGYTILDENLNYTEGDHGYASNYEYRLNRIILWDGQIRQDLADTLWTEWGTGKEVEEVVLNPSSGPNDYYLYSIVEAFEGYDDYLVVIRPEAYATTEQSIRFTDLQTSIRAYVDAETAKFIIGERSLDTFDDYYADLKAMGGDELMELAQEMYVGYEADTK